MAVLRKETRQCTQAVAQLVIVAVAAFHIAIARQIRTERAGQSGSVAFAAPRGVVAVDPQVDHVYGVRRMDGPQTGKVPGNKIL